MASASSPSAISPAPDPIKLLARRAAIARRPSISAILTAAASSCASELSSWGRRCCMCTPSRCTPTSSITSSKALLVSIAASMTFCTRGLVTCTSCSCSWRSLVNSETRCCNADIGRRISSVYRAMSSLAKLWSSASPLASGSSSRPEPSSELLEPSCHDPPASSSGKRATDDPRRDELSRRACCLASKSAAACGGCEPEFTSRDAWPELPISPCADPAVSLLGWRAPDDHCREELSHCACCSASRSDAACGGCEPELDFSCRGAEPRTCQAWLRGMWMWTGWRGAWRTASPNVSPPAAPKAVAAMANLASPEGIVCTR
mmetsp:Transcript_55314/g.160554  ORF Transcript_55314/g.160554 Transcript_55314/m.160554 type:complete len:319 (+) Transcript_55314:355-1311(+)